MTAPADPIPVSRADPRSATAEGAALPSAGEGDPAAASAAPVAASAETAAAASSETAAAPAAPASAAAPAAPASAVASADSAAPAAAAPVELLICVKCRQGAEAPTDDRRPGQQLFDEITARAAPEGVTVTAVECLQNCEAGCTVALRGGARWTYVFGNVEAAAQSAMLLEGAALYRDSADGLIPWRQRPEHFKRNCIARIPPPTPAPAKNQSPES